MSALTLTLPDDGGALALRAGQLTQCAWSPANHAAISAALLAAGQVTLALLAQGGLLSTLSVADNLTLAASYHGMPWAEAGRRTGPAVAGAGAGRRRLAHAIGHPPPNNSAPTTAAGCCCCCAALHPGRRLADRQRFLLTPTPTWPRGQTLLAKPCRAGWRCGFTCPARPAQPGAEWKEPP